MTSTDTQKIMFVEELEKAFGKPSKDGKRLQVLSNTFEYGEEFTEAEWRFFFSSLVNAIKRISPTADAEFLSLEGGTNEDEEEFKKFVTVEFLVDEDSYWALLAQQAQAEGEVK